MYVPTFGIFSVESFTDVPAGVMRPAKEGRARPRMSVAATRPPRIP
jgi:hypothetical protein